MTQFVVKMKSFYVTHVTNHAVEFSTRYQSAEKFDDKDDAEYAAYKVKDNLDLVLRPNIVSVNNGNETVVEY